MNLIYANDLDRCTTGTQRSFMVDSSAESIIIIATGGIPNFQLKSNTFSAFVQLAVSDPDNFAGSTSLFPIYNDNQNYMWEVLPKVGEYVFSISTTGQQDPCSIRVVSKSNYDFFFGTTFAQWYDAIDTVPVVGRFFCRLDRITFRTTFSSRGSVKWTL